MSDLMKFLGWLLLICGTIVAGFIFFQLKADGSFSSYSFREPHPLRTFFAATVFFGALFQSLIMIGIARLLGNSEELSEAVALILNSPSTTKESRGQINLPLKGKAFQSVSDQEFFVRVNEYADRFERDPREVIDDINSNKIPGKREKGIYYILVSKETWASKDQRQRGQF